MGSPSPSVHWAAVSSLPLNRREEAISLFEMAQLADGGPGFEPGLSDPNQTSSGLLSLA